MDKSVWIFKRPHYASDLAEAFQRLSWHTELVPEIDIIHRIYAGERPDLVITNKATETYGLEHGPGVNTVVSATEEFKIPLVWLMWDSPYYDPGLVGLDQQARAVGLGLPPICPFIFPTQKHIYCFTVSKEFLPLIKCGHAEYMPFGVNELRFKPSVTPPVYDVGFIGTSLIGQRMDGVTAMDMAGIKNGTDLRDIATAQTWRILCDIRASAMDRVSACQWLQAHVWGDGWEQVKDGITWHGKAEFDALPEVIGSCKVSLNVSKRCFPNDIAPRMLELLACGAVVVSNDLPGIKEEFGPFCAWGIESGLVPTKEAALAGMEYVRSRHTWLHRAKRILEVVPCAT